MTWYCSPDPIGPPAPNLKGSAICGSAPPLPSRTMPVRNNTTRVRPDADHAASSHSAHTSPRKSLPRLDDSSSGVSSRTP